MTKKLLMEVNTPEYMSTLTVEEGAGPKLASTRDLALVAFYYCFGWVSTWSREPITQ